MGKHEASRIDSLASASVPWARSLMGLAVGVGVGAIPAVGKNYVPGVDLLLALFPAMLQKSVVPLASILMGVVAAGVQFYAGTKAMQSRSHRGLIGMTLFAALAVVQFVIVHSLEVIPVSNPMTRTTTSFVVGFGERPKTCDEVCPRKMSDSKCIEQSKLDPSEIESCWGSSRIREGNLILVLSFLLLTSSLGALVGLAILHGARRGDAA